MSVGIVMTNELEAIVIADARGSDSIRQSDSYNKIEIFSSMNYNGAIMGTGDANTVSAIFKGLSLIEASSFDNFVAQVHKEYCTMINTYDKQFLADKKNEIKKMSMIVPRNCRNEFIVDETNKLLEEYLEKKKDHVMYCDFLCVAYDEIKGKVRKFEISPEQPLEVAFFRSTIGSGHDGAGLFLDTKLPGVECQDLKFSDLAFFALNAYSLSTTNIGVGGIPKIICIRQSDTETLALERAIALVNVSGAYLSNINESVAYTDAVRGYMKEILEAENPDYETIAQVFGLNSETLTTLPSPYSNWQTKANRIRFCKKH